MFTYFQKGMNFWSNLSSPKPVSPLNLEPTFRPPGTVLMSYPFGFVPDFRGFYFRSVFFPLVIITCAVYVAGARSPMSPAGHWDLAAFASLMGSASMFFHFELNEALVSPGVWGVVDNFLAAVAALTAATAIRSVRNVSLGWTVVTALLGAFCLLIKPSGGLVMAIAGGTLVLGLLLRIKFEPGRRRSLLRLLLRGSLLMALLFGVVLRLCLRSKYLSTANLAFGTAVIEIMHRQLALSFPQLWQLIRSCFGYLLTTFFPTPNSFGISPLLTSGCLPTRRGFVPAIQISF